MTDEAQARRPGADEALLTRHLGGPANAALATALSRAIGVDMRVAQPSILRAGNVPFAIDSGRLVHWSRLEGE
jgi:hypothetical protein